jgi:diguanylate cyclase (GGDEF)-like protein/PAS domain S-box-containing protein
MDFNLSDGEMVTENILNIAMRDLFQVSPTPLSISTTDFHSRYIKVNPAYLKLVGRTEAELLDQSISIDLPYGLDSADRLERLHLLETQGFYDLREVPMLRANGEIFPTLITAQRRKIDGESLDIEIVIDNTERKRLENQVLTASRTDAMTSLHNRAYFEQQLASITHSLIQGDTVSLSYIDLNGFKQINDNHGHAAGDYVLKTVAERIKRWSKSDDFVARIGGDEFAIISLSSPVSADTSLRHHQLAQAISQPITFNEQCVQVGAAIGVAKTQHQIDPSILLNRADRLMYQAKSTGNLTDVRLSS